MNQAAIEDEIRRARQWHSSLVNEKSARGVYPPQDRSGKGAPTPAAFQHV